LGKHLIIDGYDIMSESCLDDLDYIYRVLADIPRMIGMEIMQGPFVWKCQVAHNLGVTGVVVITTSHLSIHTWPQRHYLSFDCYSCQDFDEQFVVAEIQRRFEPKTLRQSVLSRELPQPRICCSAFRKEGA
jgi:S-adenosylmethionine decarboxylase